MDQEEEVFLGERMLFRSFQLRLVPGPGSRLLLRHRCQAVHQRALQLPHVNAAQGIGVDPTGLNLRMRGTDAPGSLIRYARDESLRRRRGPDLM